MKDRGTLNTQEALVEVYLTADEPQTLVSKFSCSTKILDAEYKPSYLDEVIKMCDLTKGEQQQLVHILQKYEHLFDGTLGELNMDPMSLHPIDRGTKSVHARPYTVPRSVEQQLCTAYRNCKISGHLSPRRRLYFRMGIPNISLTNRLDSYFHKGFDVNSSTSVLLP
jgi:Trp operon repressor